MGVALPTLADTAAPVEAEPDYSKLFDQAIARMDSYLKDSKRKVFAAEAELNKLKKNAESAKWRVTSAREKYDEALALLSGGEADEARSKLAKQHALLKQDAVKLGTILARAEGLQRELAAQSTELKRLHDDVAIETDRFPETDHRQKRTSKLLLDSEWTQGKAQELIDLTKSELEEPVAETFEQAKVGVKPHASDFAEPGTFQAGQGISLEQLQRDSAAGKATRVGQIQRGKEMCDAWCTIDDPSGLRGTSGDLQLRCSGGQAPAAEKGWLVLSSWKAGKVDFPAFSRLNELPCGK